MSQSLHHRASRVHKENQALKVQQGLKEMRVQMAHLATQEQMGRQVSKDHKAQTAHKEKRDLQDQMDHRERMLQTNHLSQENLENQVIFYFTIFYLFLIIVNSK